jgi:predicted 2-oxoglutarate/Fe(II)-dependent dioxygenase YbiX
MPSLTKYDKIHYYQDVIKDPYQLVEIIEDTDSILNEDTPITKWKKWETGDSSYDFGYQKFIKESINQSSHSTLVSIYEIIKDAIYEASYDYSSVHNIDLGYLTSISISKYSTGKEMGSHIDSYDDGRVPVLSVVLYLNDNYEGGELNFQQQGISIKPSAGSLIAFPSVSPYYHESKTVTKGIKYMSPGFWYKD